jgi:hypothetical protein
VEHRSGPLKSRVECTNCEYLKLKLYQIDFWKGKKVTRLDIKGIARMSRKNLIRRKMKFSVEEFTVDFSANAFG